MNTQEALDLVRERVPAAIECKADSNGSIVVNIDGFWLAAYDRFTEKVNDHALVLCKTYGEFLTLQRDRPDLHNTYVVINPDGSKFSAETEGEALNKRNDRASFVGLLGSSRKKMDVLALGAHEKPNNFEKNESIALPLKNSLTIILPGAVGLRSV